MNQGVSYSTSSTTTFYDDIYIYIPEWDKSYPLKFWDKREEFTKETLLANYETVPCKDPTITLIQIPKDKCPTLKSHSTTKTVQKCAYDATSKFIKQHFGGDLDWSDSTWYTNHEVTTSSGCPEQFTLPLLQSLVKPYGYGISQVRVKNSLPIIILQDDKYTFDQLYTSWITALRVPIPALATNLPIPTDENIIAYLNTLLKEGSTEIEKANIAGLIQRQLGSGFKFFTEDSDLHGEPWVIFRAEQSERATGGGHAEYMAPRARLGNIPLAIQFDRLSNIDYASKPFDLDYDYSAQAATLYIDGDDVKLPEGNQTVFNLWNSSGSSSSTAHDQLTQAFGHLPNRVSKTDKFLARIASDSTGDADVDEVNAQLLEWQRSQTGKGSGGKYGNNPQTGSTSPNPFFVEIENPDTDLLFCRRTYSVLSTPIFEKVHASTSLWHPALMMYHSMDKAFSFPEGEEIDFLEMIMTNCKIDADLTKEQVIEENATLIQIIKEKGTLATLNPSFLLYLMKSGTRPEEYDPIFIEVFAAYLDNYVFEISRVTSDYFKDEDWNDLLAIKETKDFTKYGTNNKIANFITYLNFWTRFDFLADPNLQAHVPENTIYRGGTSLNVNSAPYFQVKNAFLTRATEIARAFKRKNGLVWDAISTYMALTTKELDDILKLHKVLDNTFEFSDAQAVGKMLVDSPFLSACLFRDISTTLASALTGITKSESLNVASFFVDYLNTFIYEKKDVPVETGV